MKKIVWLLMLVTLAASTVFAQINRIEVYGNDTYYNGVKIAPGMTVVAKDMYGVELAQTEVTQYGKYQLFIHLATENTYGYEYGKLVEIYVNDFEVATKSDTEYPLSFSEGQDRVEFDFDVRSNDMIETNVMCYFKSSNSWLNGGKLPNGSKVEIYIKDTNVKIGESTIENQEDGSYRAIAYGDATYTGWIKEGADYGEELEFYINEAPAKVLNGDPKMGGHMQEIELDLYASTEPMGGMKFCQYSGDVYVDNVKAEANTIIKAVDNDFFVCGEYVISNTGEGYDMMVYGDDTENTPLAYQDEGADEGEVVGFFVKPDGEDQYMFAYAEPADVEWTEGGDKDVDLYVHTGNVIETNKFCDFNGVNCMLGGIKVPSGATITATYVVHEEEGGPIGFAVCGRAENVMNGSFDMRVYGDDERTANFKEGPVSDNELTFYINGIKAEIAETSQDDGVFQEGGMKTITLVAPVTNVAPAAPASVTAANNGDYTVTVNWDAVDEDDIKGYKVFRKVDGGDAVLVNELVDGTQFVDNNVEWGNTYSYGIAAVDNYDLESGITWSNDVTDVDENTIVKEKFFLKQNFPNPFNSFTNISFGLKETQNVKLTIYNLLGEEVKVLVDESMTAGKHNVAWNGKNKDSKAVPSGVYYYRIQTNDDSIVKSMMYLK